ncbi:MAG: hypothetical protein WBA29_05455 [Xanthobacteraceae bacterium]
MTYVRRYIDVTFEGDGKTTVKFDARDKYALRTSARILKAGGFNFGELALELRGLSKDHIHQLSTFGTLVRPNYNYHVRVDAGDDVNGMSTVFEGGIQQAWADMRAMPDVPFHVIAVSGGNATVAKTPPSTFSGPTDVPMMLEKLAQQTGLSFENSGVKAKIADPYFFGSGWKQMKEIIDAAGVEGFIDNKTLAIWPRDGARNGDALYISAETGMRDYPSFTQYGVQVRTEFRKAITYGGLMEIKSDIQNACGTWRVIRIDYDLQANTPRGNWFAVLNGSKVGAPVTVAGR